MMRQIEFTAACLFTLVTLGVAAQPAAAKETGGPRYPDLPQELTSFGAAIIGDQLYAYGGHTGSPHSYSTAEQSNEMIVLDLAQPDGWKSIAKGPRLQGLAMVPVAGKLYRLGGFSAKNAEGEDQDLWSQDSAAVFDPGAGKWTELPPLPEPRSSFDAAVIDGKIHIAGGWQLRGDEENIWHKTAWRFDPAAKNPGWETLPEPPFQRRALALAAHNDKLYAIGGMTPENSTSNRVDVFDPATGKWSQGPDLPGKSLNGFGSSAYAHQGRLYVSTVGGQLLRLAGDGKSWKQVQQLAPGRFFHRMLPYRNALLVLGGANMQIGKLPSVEALKPKK